MTDDKLTDRQRAMLSLKHNLDALGIGPWWVATAAFKGAREQAMWRRNVQEHGAKLRGEA